MKTTEIYYLHKGDNIPFYIGKTNSNIKTNRIYNHRYKFGKNVIKEEIDIVPIHEWKFWEKFYILLYKSWGFKLENKNNGGGGLTKHKETTKRKISEKIKNNKERGSKISKSSKGLTKSHKGRKFSKKHKENIKKTRGFLKNRITTWLKIPILQYDLENIFIKEWPSQKEASNYIGTSGDGIGACCRGRQKKAYGYIWKFKN